MIRHIQSSLIEDINIGVLDLYSTKPKIPSWHFKYSKLKQAMKLWSRRKASAGGATNCYDVPSPEIWKKVDGVREVLDSIDEVSRALFESKYSTANVYLYHLHQLYKILIQFTTHSDGFIKEVSKSMLKKFSSYWKRMFIWLAITAALDPRFKIKYVEFICSQEPKDGNLRGAAVFEVIEEKFGEYVIRFPEKEGSISDSSSSTPGNVNQNFSVLQDYHQFIQNQSDLVRYLGEPLLPWSPEFDVLTWWSTASLKYPTLSRMAREFSALPHSTATSYEAFYTVGL